jgi:hypothetical protein
VLKQKVLIQPLHLRESPTTIQARCVEREAVRVITRVCRSCAHLSLAARVQQGVNQQFIIPKKYVAHKNVPAEAIDLVPGAAMHPVSSGHIPPRNLRLLHDARPATNTHSHCIAPKQSVKLMWVWQFIAV